VGKPSATCQPTRPTQPFILSGSINEYSELDSDVCYRVYGWRRLVKATEVTAGLAESNGSPPAGGWLKVTCGLTACAPGSAPDPALDNSGRTLPLSYVVNETSVSLGFVTDNSCTSPVIHKSI